MQVGVSFTIFPRKACCLGKRNGGMIPGSDLHVALAERKRSGRLDRR